MARQTQKERQERSREEIYQAALEEFGADGYDAVTMERICVRHGISKGMMYHYFSHKDELFLLCVEKTFAELKDHLEQELPELTGMDFPEAVKAFFMTRESFFQSRPLEKTIFENALLYPPRSLAAKIQGLHAPLRDLNRAFFWRLAPQMPLRPGLEAADAARYLEGVGCFFQAMAAYGREDHEIRDLHTMLEVGGKLMDLVLYGILQQPAAAGAAEGRNAARQKILEDQKAQL